MPDNLNQPNPGADGYDPEEEPVTWRQIVVVTFCVLMFVFGASLAIGVASLSDDPTVETQSQDR